MALQLYGKTSFLDKLKIFFILCGLPAALVTRLILSPRRAYEKHKSWSRVASDGIFRFFSSNLRVNQMQYIMGTSRDVYATWAKKNKRPILMDDLGNDASLMWFTDRRTSGKVVYYLHGGTYQLPMQDYAAPFLMSLLNELKKSTEEDYALVALNYSLYPSASFPTQLLQASQGLSHLLTLGIKPEDIHLVGESAGGGLILQVLSHILHPYESVPKLSLTNPLGGAFLMSPWVCLTTEAPSFTSNSDSDALPGRTWAYLASDILAKLPDAGRSYVEPLKAPNNWWTGIDTLVNKGVLFVHENGIHTDPYLAHLANEKVNGKIVDLILDHFRG